MLNLLWLVTACGGGSGGEGADPLPSAGFELQPGAASIPVRQYSEGRLIVRVVRQGGFSGPIEIGLAAPPAGISAAAIVVEAHEEEASLPLRIGASVPLGSFDLVLRGSSGAAIASANLRLEVQSAQPSSEELIRAALDAGRIDLGTSLLYRAHAAFGSSRLPPEFVGSGPAGEDLALLLDIEAAIPNLSPSLVEQLQPYRVRPADPGSVFNLGSPVASGVRPQSARERPLATATFAERCPGGRREWISKRSTQHPVRAFALCLGDALGDLSAANHLLKVLAVVDKAYGLMTAATAMGPAKPDLWGDDAIDVYVVPPDSDAPRAEGGYAVEGVRGVAFPQPPFVDRGSSGYVMLPKHRLAQADYQFTVIHELFHVLQFAQNHKLTGHWFTEASASWASIHYNRTAGIDPPANDGLHRERFGGFQKSASGLLNTAGSNAYYSYVWPLFMEQEGGARLVGGAWASLQSATSDAEATDAIDAQLPFRDNFRRFAVRNLNQQYAANDPLPRTQRYISLDPPFPDNELLPADGVKSKSHDVAPGGKESLSFGRAIEPLSAVYFNVTVTDAKLKKVVFDLGGLQGGGLDVDALVLIDGAWEAQPRNLNGKSELTFCLDDPKEELWNIVFVISNHQKSVGSLASAEIGVTGGTTPCDTVWAGSTRTVVTAPGLEVTVTAEVVFEYDETAPPAPFLPFRLRSGTWTYRSVSEALCPITGHGAGAMGGPPLDPRVANSTHAALEVYTSSTPATVRAIGETMIDYRQTDCRGNEEPAQGAIGWLYIEGPGQFFVSEDGNTLEGTVESTTQEVTVRDHWSLTRRRQ